MEPQATHKWKANVSFDGGDLDCGNGLLLLIRRHIDPLDAGQLMEILSTDSSVEQDLPSWCRLTKNELVSWTKHGNQRSYLICKGGFDPALGALENNQYQDDQQMKSLDETTNKYVVSAVGVGTASGIGANALSGASQISDPDAMKNNLAVSDPIGDLPFDKGSFPEPLPVVSPLSVVSIGSWPRPRWMVQSLHAYLEGRLSEKEFQEIADDAVRLAVDAQLRAGVDMIVDGEQRRDNYASFVGNRLQNCQLVPLVDLLPFVDNPEAFEQEMHSLGVPAAKVRHPVVFGPIARRNTLALREFEFVRKLTTKPIKVALPGPYLLTRIMWMECIADKAYVSREALAQDLVKVLKEELYDLLTAGVSIVQFDEPVLTEIVFASQTKGPRFMCGALSARFDPEAELQFALKLINEVVEFFPKDRLALHVCRGNWTDDESVALSGDYRPLLSVLKNVKVGTLFLEFCTPRAGDMEVLREIPSDKRIGLGVVNPKTRRVESIDEVLNIARRAITMVGKERLLLNPDCGFATFADSPVAQRSLAEAKLKVIVEAAKLLAEERDLLVTEFTSGVESFQND